MSSDHQSNSRNSNNNSCSNSLKEYSHKINNNIPFLYDVVKKNTKSDKLLGSNNSKTNTNSSRKIKRARYSYSTESSSSSEIDHAEEYSSSDEEAEVTASDTESLTSSDDMNGEYNMIQSCDKTKRVLLTLLAAGIVQDEYKHSSSNSRFKRKGKRGRPKKDPSSSEEEKRNDRNTYVATKTEERKPGRGRSKKQKQRRNVRKQNSGGGGGTKNSRIPKGASLKEEKKIRAEYASILRVKKMDPWHRLKDYFDLTYVGPMERAFLDREKIKKFEYLDILVASLEMLKNPGKCGMEICMEIAKVRNIRKSVREEWRNNKSMQTEAKSTVVRRQLEKPRVVALQRWFDVSATHRALQAAANYFESLR